MNIRAYEPASWVYPTGARKRFAQIKRKGMPSVKGWHMITLTTDPSLFRDRERAYEIAKSRLRRFLWCVKQHHNVPKNTRYFWKLEFTANGWAHWHICIDIKQKLDVEYIRNRWTLGRTNVVYCSTNHDYLLKYLVKAGDLPDWVQDYKKRIRFFQSSNLFTEKKSEKAHGAVNFKPAPSPVEFLSIREKMEKWDKQGVLNWDDRNGDRYLLVDLKKPFIEVYRELIERRSPITRDLFSIVVDFKTLNVTYEYILKQCQNKSQEQMLTQVDPVTQIERDYSLMESSSQHPSLRENLKTTSPTVSSSATSHLIQMFTSIGLTP